MSAAFVELVLRIRFPFDLSFRQLLQEQPVGVNDRFSAVAQPAELGNAELTFTTTIRKVALQHASKRPSRRQVLNS